MSNPGTPALLSPATQSATLIDFRGPVTVAKIYPAKPALTPAPTIVPQPRPLPQSSVKVIPVTLPTGPPTALTSPTQQPSRIIVTPNEAGMVMQTSEETIRRVLQGLSDKQLAGDKIDMPLLKSVASAVGISAQGTGKKDLLQEIREKAANYAVIIYE